MGYYNDVKHKITYGKCSCGATKGTEYQNCDFVWKGLSLVCKNCGTEYVYHTYKGEYVTQRATSIFKGDNPGSGSQAIIPANTIVKVTEIKQSSWGRWIGLVSYGGKKGYIHLADCKFNANAGKHSFVNGKCTQCGVAQVGSKPGVYKASEDGEMYYQNVWASKKKSFKKGDSITVNKVAPTTYNFYWGYTPDGYVVAMDKLELNPVVPINVGSPIAIEDGVYNIVCATNSCFAMDVYDASTSNSAQIQLWNRNGSVAQTFRFQKNSDGTYRITNTKSGKVFDVAGNGTSNHSNVIQFEWHGRDNQRWYVEQNWDGSYSFRSKYNNLYLDIYDGAIKAGSPIHTYIGNGTAAQRFNLDPVSGTNIFAGNTTIVSGISPNYNYNGGRITPNPTVMKLVYANNNLTVGSASNNGAYVYSQTCSIQKGKTYRVDLSSVKRVAGNHSAAHMLVYDFSADRIIHQEKLALSTAARSCTFTASQSGTLIFYAGLVGQCANKATQWSGVRVYDVLAKGTDYTVAYGGNTNAGQGTVTVNAKGAAAGSKTVSFAILPKALTSAKYAAKSYKFKGKSLHFAPTVKSGGKKLKNGRDFTVSYWDDARKGIVTAMVQGKGNYSGTQVVSFKVIRAKQPMQVKGKTVTVKASKTRKNALVVGKKLVIKKAKGTLSYKIISKNNASKKLKVNAKTGAITIPKGMKKGTYKLKMKVTAKGNVYYKAGSKTVTFKVRVK